MIATTTIGRAKLNHPNWKEGTYDDQGLHDAVKAMMTEVSDHIASRYFAIDSLAAGASVDIDHNFKCPLGKISFSVFTRDGSGELTPVTDATTPARSTIGLTATPGFITTKTRVTNNSGSPQTLSVMATQDGGKDAQAFSIANNQAAAASLAGLVFDSARAIAVEILFCITRRTDSFSYDEIGHLYLVKSPSLGTWRTTIDSKLDNAGVSFSVNSAGQVQYVSSNINGSNYAGTLRIAGIRELLT